MVYNQGAAPIEDNIEVVSTDLLYERVHHHPLFHTVLEFSVPHLKT
jgi:hypothetical protein